MKLEFHIPPGLDHEKLMEMLQSTEPFDEKLVRILAESNRALIQAQQELMTQSVEALITAHGEMLGRAVMELKDAFQKRGAGQTSSD